MPQGLSTQERLLRELQFYKDELKSAQTEMERERLADIIKGTEMLLATLKENPTLSDGV